MIKLKVGRGYKEREIELNEGVYYADLELSFLPHYCRITVMQDTHELIAVINCEEDVVAINRYINPNKSERSGETVVYKVEDNDENDFFIKKSVFIENFKQAKYFLSRIVK